MQLDFGGTLASLVNDLLPGTAPAAGGGKPMADEAFQQLLSRLAAVIEDRGVGLPPEVRAAFQPVPSGEGTVPVSGISSESAIPPWMDQLASLAARVKIQAQSPDRSIMPPAESEADLADLMAAVGPILQDVFRETAGGGDEPLGSGTSGAPEGEVGAATAESPAIRLLELVTGLPKEGSIDMSEREPKAWVGPASSVADAPSIPASKGGVAAGPAGDDGFRIGFGSASDAPEREPDVPVAVKPEVPAPEKFSEKPDGPESTARPAEVFHPEALKDAAPAPGTPSLRSVPAATVARPIDHPQWPDALGERLLWLRDNDVQTAELQIHPRHLGPVAVRIQIHEDQTTIQFASPHAVVREALEAALPRLRELFAGQQLPPAQVEVGQQFGGDQADSQSGRSDGRPPARQWSDGAGDVPAVPEDEGPRRSPATGNRLLSLYA